MKKAIPFLLALALVCSLSLPALAANTESGSTLLTTEVGTTYIVSIPTSQEIDYGATSTALTPLTLTTANLPAGGKVRVTPAAANTYTLSNGATGTIDYALKSGDNAFTSADLDEVGEAISLSIAITEAEWNAAESGNYTGTLGFAVSYVDPLSGG